MAERDWDDGTPQVRPVRLIAAELFTAVVLVPLVTLSAAVMAVWGGTARLMAAVALLAAGAAVVQLVISIRLRRECEILRGTQPGENKNAPSRT